jgi:AcrR family transcriptional regulator
LVCIVNSAGMAKAKKNKEKGEALDFTTEEKIRNAALKLFTQKGFAATRTRDISEEAGINLALLNYYFRSKEKLFELVMGELLRGFIKGMLEILNDTETSIDEKVEIFVTRYTELLIQQPDIPLFIFHEMKMNPEKLASKIGASGVFKSYFIKQLKEAMEKGKLPSMHPLHFVMNLIGLTVFPFIAAPLMKQLSGVDTKAFLGLAEERKTLIPKWIKTMMKAK